MDDRKRIPMTESDRKENQPYDVDVIPKDVKPTKTTRVINKFVLLALVLIALSLLRIFTWAADNESVLVIKNAPFPTRTIREHPTAGGVVFLDADYCKNKDIEGQLRMSFVSESKETLLPLTKESSEKGCQRIEVPIIIPKDLTPGEHKVRFVVTYDVNPLHRNQVIEFESKEFTVDPAQ